MGSGLTRWRSGRGSWGRSELVGSGLWNWSLDAEDLYGRCVVDTPCTTTSNRYDCVTRLRMQTCHESWI